MAARTRREAVEYLKDYILTYDKQPFYEDYSDRTFLEDMLYGIGVALDDEYRWALGFDSFKAYLRRHLADENAAEPQQENGTK